MNLLTYPWLPSAERRALPGLLACWHSTHSIGDHSVRAPIAYVGAVLRLLGHPNYCPTCKGTKYEREPGVLGRVWPCTRCQKTGKGTPEAALRAFKHLFSYRPLYLTPKGLQTVPTPATTGRPIGIAYRPRAGVRVSSAMPGHDVPMPSKGASGTDPLLRAYNERLLRVASPEELVEIAEQPYRTSADSPSLIDVLENGTQLLSVNPTTYQIEGTYESLYQQRKKSRT